MIIIYSIPSNPPQRYETDSNSITFGRNPLPDQRIDIDLAQDEYISHIHARITYEDDKYWIEDIGSTNGTWVNDRKISGKRQLGPGDKVRVGWTIIDVAMGTAPFLPEAGPAPDVPTVVTGSEEPSLPVSDAGPAFDSPTVVTSAADASPIPDLVQIPDAPGNDKGPVEVAFLSEGTIVTLSGVATLLHTVSGGGPTDDGMPQTLCQIKAVNDLSQMLGSVDTLDSMVQILIKLLPQAIPSAQRGAVLLPDERDDLLLKAHWPQGDYSISMTWINRAFKKREHFIWAAPAESRTDGDTPHSAIYYNVQAAIYVPLLAGEEVLGVMYVDNPYTRTAFSITDLELMRTIANQVAIFIKDNVLQKNLRREEKLISNLSRQFSPKIVKRILEKGESMRMGGEWVDPVTVLISDVRGFTALSAKMGPDEVVRMLNEMFDAFIPIIFEHDGMVDKYVGDAVLAVFGSPEKDDQQWEKAVRAALVMQQAATMLGEGRRVRRLPVFGVGISIHTGAAIHGYIGSTERKEYTIIGDTVNQASRCCDGAGPGEIVISKRVYERVYRLVDVKPKIIRTKHPEIEPDLEAFVVKGLKKNVSTPGPQSR